MTISAFLPWLPSFTGPFIPTKKPSIDGGTQQKEIPIQPNPLHTAPQVYPTKKGITLITPAPTIRNIVLPSGGAAGFLVPDALAELGEPFFRDLREISACSCGAVIGSLLAAGVTPSELVEKNENIAGPKLLKRVKDFSSRYPFVAMLPERIYTSASSIGKALTRMLIFKFLARNWQRRGEEIVQTLDKLSTEQVAKHLQKPEIWQIVENQYLMYRLGPQSKEENEKRWQRLIFLRNNEWDESSLASRERNMLTFSDIALLHQIEPTIFKKINIVASRVVEVVREDGSVPLSFEKEIFNEANTPNMPIVLAVRASITIPSCIKDVSYKEQRYQDGGMTSRNPVEVFYQPYDEHHPSLENSRHHAETAVLNLMQGHKQKARNHALHTKSDISAGRLAFEGFTQWLLNSPTYKKTSAQDRRKLHDAGPNVIVINRGGINTFDFSASPQKMKKAKELARANVRQYLALRQNQACHFSFTNVEQAAASLNEEQRNAILEAGDPTQQPGFNQLDDEVQAAQSKFYKLAVDNYLKRQSTIKVLVDTVKSPTSSATLHRWQTM